jgi:IS5 family transposase
MMDYTTLCKLKNCIRPETWKKINETLARYAIQENLIDGEQLRLDTTAVETNIHWPTDSSLLWDTYRVLARLIEQAREIDPEAVGDRRLHTSRAKRLYTRVKWSRSPRKESEPSRRRAVKPILTSAPPSDSAPESRAPSPS